MKIATCPQCGEQLNTKKVGAYTLDYICSACPFTGQHKEDLSIDLAFYTIVKHWGELCYKDASEIYQYLSDDDLYKQFTDWVYTKVKPQHRKRKDVPKMIETAQKCLDDLIYDLRLHRQINYRFHWEVMGYWNNKYWGSKD